jgi:plasmid stabilization system protein ParE
MKIKLSLRAQADARTIRAWWRAHGRQNKRVFIQELKEARLLLGAAPKFGRVFTVHKSGAVIRTIPMLKSKCNLYYTVDESSGAVEVVHIWSPVKGEPVL